MHHRLLAAGVLGLVMTTGINAQVINIDNYNQGTGGNTFSHDQTGPGSNSNLHTGLTATTVGDQRIARVHVVAGAGTVNINNTSDPGTFSISLPSSSTIQAHFHLYYGYNSYDSGASSPTSGTHNFADLNVDTTSLVNPQVAFTLIRMDNPGDIRVTLVSDRTGSAAFRTVTLNQPGNLTPINVSVTQADFAAGSGSGTLNWADIDQVILESGDLGDSTDLRLDNLQFTSVPEPTTYALIALAGLAVGGGAWHRRRKNAKAAEAVLTTI